MKRKFEERIKPNIFFKKGDRNIEILEMPILSSMLNAYCGDIGFYEWLKNLDDETLLLLSLAMPGEDRFNASEEKISLSIGNKKKLSISRIEVVALGTYLTYFHKEEKKEELLLQDTEILKTLNILSIALETEKFRRGGLLLIEDSNEKSWRLDTSSTITITKKFLEHALTLSEDLEKNNTSKVFTNETILELKNHAKELLKNHDENSSSLPEELEKEK